MMQLVSFTESATRVQRSNLKSAAWGITCAALAISLLHLPANGEQNAVPKMEVLPLRGAISLYDKACVRCHGPGGSFYGSDLGKGKTDAQLRKMVWEMCIAQGGLTVSQREVDAMTAYHRSIMKSEPYIEVIAVSPTAVSGEATPGAIIELQVGSKALPITLTENRWNVLLDTSKPATIVARHNGKTTRLPVGLGKYTLHQP
jgi:hypothetical protein